MSDIKIKPKETIKQIDKGIVSMQKMKNNLISTKEKINGMTIDDDNNSGEEYAGRKIQNGISYTTRNGVSKFNEFGKKSVVDTKNNIIKGKGKIDNLKSKIKNVNNTNKAIKSGTKKTIKTANNTAKLTKKSIKTSEKAIKTSGKIVKESAKMSKRAVQVAKATTKATIKGIKVAVKATVATVKAIIAGTKALISAIVAGGWIAILIILVIVLIAGIIAAIFNSNGDEDYDSSQIPNSEIVLVAKAQIGNEGGDKFWKWYGFEEHVHWCACYVSWCANECGYIEKGIIPKFAVCTDGINWFKERNKWNDRSESYYPMVGDIIFFDWKDENGNQDGTSDHVGIVTRTDIDNKNIYTVEGNTSNKCAERMYSFEDTQVMGYGTPKY